MQSQTRQTRQRALILEELRRSRQHPTAAELYASVRERMPSISLGTVYRNLDFLAERGLIRRLDGNGSSRRFDGDISPHPHVLCLRCGRIGDICDGSGQSPKPPQLSVEGLNATGFARITGAQVVYYAGICESCNQSQDRDRDVTEKETDPCQAG